MIIVTSEQAAAIRRPGKASGRRGSLAILGGSGEASEVRDHSAGVEIENADAIIGGSGQPVLVGRELKSVDHTASVEAVHMGTLVEAPHHNLTVLTTGSAQGTIGGDGGGVDETSMAVEVELQLEVGEIPNLHNSVPSSGDDEGVADVRGELNAANPLSVSVSTADGGLALAKGVPQLEGTVARTRDNLSVVGRESDGKNILLVSNESLGGNTVLQVPKAESAIPRAGQSESSIGGEDNVRDDVGVALERTLGNTGSVILAVGIIQSPGDDGLVTGRGNQHIRSIAVSREGGDGATVTL